MSASAPMMSSSVALVRQADVEVVVALELLGDCLGIPHGGAEVRQGAYMSLR